VRRMEPSRHGPGARDEVADRSRHQGLLDDPSSEVRYSEKWRFGATLVDRR